ncbi:GNAT family N-acetyltransferase [Anaeromicropila herbilytica]|uniref:N-acetyltransferase domain-containing protein n=1 Tax=Anaeromicropila herbilytica TaxID=2785025 RepID=A0A7R7ENG1_9FIRM|nr:GNAT family N-acetyltransferase [Anaeromicropila herbilytica]BCN31816.1 hypothetical protein bsdtb5_31110 [Anaeromicropila herbilytica]
MRVRTIQLEDIAQYEQIGVEEGRKSSLNLQKWLDTGRTSLDWCFVIELDGQFLGRIIYGIFEEEPYDIKVWQIKLADTEGGLLNIGNKLLADSIEILKEKGFNTVEYHLYSTTPELFETFQSIFKTHGFQIVQEKKSFETNQVNNIDKAKKFEYKTLKEVGEKVFIEAIESVTEGTLDREDVMSIKLHGSRKAATLYFELLKEIDFNETWWRIAYNEKKEMIGLVVPQKFSEEEGAINYIGVTPTQRGNGYVRELLWEGARIMIEDGIQNIMADIDIQNYPLEKALEQLGYQCSRSELVLKLEL